MDMPENASSSDPLSAVSDNGIHQTHGPKHIKLLGPAIRFEGLVGTADKQAATRKKALRRMLQDKGHQFGEDVSEDVLMSELQKQYPGRRVKIIVINVNPRDRQSVLNGMKYMDKFQPRSRDAMLDYAIANLGMLDQHEDRDKLCEAIAKNGKHLGPHHRAALEEMSKDPKVAQALTEAGYVTGTDAHQNSRTSLPSTNALDGVSEKQASKRDDMIRSRDTLGRGNEGRSL